MQGTILDMIEDVSTALQWVTDNVHTYGGDPQRTVVVGQSAGGQLAALAVLFQVHYASAAPTLHSQSQLLQWLSIYGTSDQVLSCAVAGNEQQHLSHASRTALQTLERQSGNSFRGPVRRL
jgi:acetyl esterase/lipase